MQGLAVEEDHPYNTGHREEGQLCVQKTKILEIHPVVIQNVFFYALTAVQLWMEGGGVNIFTKQTTNIFYI